MRFNLSSGPKLTSGGFMIAVKRRIAWTIRIDLSPAEKKNLSARLDLMYRPLASYQSFQKADFLFSGFY
jgi:hypothetical protein